MGKRVDTNAEVDKNQGAVRDVTEEESAVNVKRIDM